MPVMLMTFELNEIYLSYSKKELDKLGFSNSDVTTDLFLNIRLYISNI